MLHNLPIFHVLVHVLTSLQTFIHYIHTHTPLTHDGAFDILRNMRNTSPSLPHTNPLHTRYQTTRLFQAICRYIFFATDPPRADYLATADEEKIVVSPRIENIRVYYAHRASEEDEAFSFLPLGMLLTVLLRRTIGRAIMRSDTSTCRLSQTSSCPSPRHRRPHTNERNRYHTMLRYRRACHNGITTYNDDDIG